jgi:hypothetical protein
LGTALALGAAAARDFGAARARGFAVAAVFFRGIAAFFVVFARGFADGGCFFVVVFLIFAMKRAVCFPRPCRALSFPMSDARLNVDDRR